VFLFSAFLRCSLTGCRLLAAGSGEWDDELEQLSINQSAGPAEGNERKSQLLGRPEDGYTEEKRREKWTSLSVVEKRCGSSSQKRKGWMREGVLEEERGSVCLPGARLQVRHVPNVIGGLEREQKTRHPCTRPRLPGCSDLVD
jgi:hypothetical protein